MAMNKSKKIVHRDVNFPQGWGIPAGTAPNGDPKAGIFPRGDRDGGQISPEVAARTRAGNPRPRPRIPQKMRPTLFHRPTSITASQATGGVPQVAFVARVVPAARSSRVPSPTPWSASLPTRAEALRRQL
ncbi:hypothetical protein PIB30_052674 [Stylosanthes scabra]|uniref:Uncharacterized protein n=1 Tax=Stylosanthes scabra TaxID=79078 RepID=A0ABU6RIF3_9FABA|nr:hypothetical protein [Stylosanthes scabra]